jgi:hypothetical protein
MGVHLLVLTGGPEPNGYRPPDICNVALRGDENLLQNAAHHLPLVVRINANVLDRILTQCCKRWQGAHLSRVEKP